MYEVIVGNVGTVLRTSSLKAAERKYDAYVAVSKSGVGRAGSEPVTLLSSGDEIVREYSPPPAVEPLVNEKCMYLGCECTAVNGTYCASHCIPVLAGQESKGEPLTKEEAKAAYDYLVRLSYRIRHAEPQNIDGRNTQSYYVCGAIGDVRDYLVQVGVSDITELHAFTEEKTWDPCRCGHNKKVHTKHGCCAEGCDCKLEYGV